MQAFIIDILNNFFKKLYISYIPNGRDNLKQISLKLLFLLSIILLIISSVFLANYFWESEHQNSIINDSREFWHEALETQNEEKIQSHMQAFLKENDDFKGWITINGTKIDNPIYQTDNNQYYLNHNQLKQKSDYGTLFFDYRSKISGNSQDKNIVIYGQNMKNGSMFGSLKNYKNLDYFKAHPTISFSTFTSKSTYKIYSVFILNSDKADDNGYIYNIYRKTFNKSKSFENWANEALERSVINTGIDLNYKDEIITLVTNCDDFPNARLVVMARKLRSGEKEEINYRLCSVNYNPRYPAKWYTYRGLDYPFK